MSDTVDHPLLTKPFLQAKELSGQTVWWQPVPGVPKIAIGKVGRMTAIHDITEVGDQLVSVTRDGVTALAPAPLLHVLELSRVR